MPRGGPAPRPRNLRETKTTVPLTCSRFFLNQSSAYHAIHSLLSGRRYASGPAPARLPAHRVRVHPVGVAAAAEGAVDHLDPGLLLVGFEGVFPEGFRDHAAPAVEAHAVRLGGERGLAQAGDRGADDAGGDGGRPQQAEEGAAVEVAVPVALQKAFVAFLIVHLVSGLPVASVGRFGRRGLLVVRRLSRSCVSRRAGRPAIGPARRRSAAGPR